LRKIITIEYCELEKLDNTIINLRNQVGQLQNEVSNLHKEISLLKDSGENILVIVKDRDKPDVHEYRTNEKNVLVDLVSENSKIRERYDDVSRQKDNVENQKQMILLKYKEMETIYKNKITKLEEYVDYLENRSILSRLKNDKKPINQDTLISFDEPMMIEGPTKTVYTDDELRKLEEDARLVKKPRGWQFMNEFVDTEGNVYYKGKLQPHLKGTKKAT